MAKMGITCNGAEIKNIYSTFIFGSAAIASGDDVVIYFTPAGAPALVKGKLEEMNGAKGLPDLMEMYDGFIALGGKIIFCELALDVNDIAAEDLREDVELAGATTFLNEVKDATITFSF